MFLAFKELKHSKTKFTLIIVVIILISYLVYFLTSLANGLASSYTDAVNSWEADEIIMTDDANDNLMMSSMTDEDFDNLDVDGEKAKLAISPAVIDGPENEETEEENDTDEEMSEEEAEKAKRLDIYFFGVEEDNFFVQDAADLTENSVIADESLQLEGFEVGDIIEVSGSEDEYEIVGFTEKNTYQTVPVVFVNLETWQIDRFGEDVPEPTYSGVIVRGETKDLSDDFYSYSTSEFIKTLPGYTAQVLTFTVMIVFLIFIAAFVLGIFIYVLTIQKTSMFGVMKAQGISNGYIGGSVIMQTILLVAIGIVAGLVLTTVSGYFLTGIIPFSTNLMFYVYITIAFFVFAIFGALFSVRAVLKIDPLKAIGG